MMRKLIAILILAFLLRIYGINWDAGFHLHPDERMLIMVADRIHFFDQLNPQFFNYGSLPIYLLKGVSQIIGLDNYQAMLSVGRYLSIFFDLLTILFIYKIAQFLFKSEKVALFASFFYAIAFFAIQNSHFFISDVFLTFFTTLLIYLLLKFFNLPSWNDRNKMVVLIGAVFSAILATKLTGIIFYPVIILTFILIPDKNKKSPSITFIIFNFSLLIFNFIFTPYAYLNYKKFLTDVLLQIKMNNDPYIFPYTLQYVGTLPYLYSLKNIFLWGLGPIISILSIIGMVKFIQKKFSIFNFQFSIFIAFYLFYFLIIGRSAVKFMRYMLPMYPFFATMAGLGIYQIYKLKIKNVLVAQLLNYLITFLALVWTLMFMNIYSQPHTRLAATNWILKNIPAGSTLAVEHWDDRLPIFGGENFRFEELQLYNLPDDERKWFTINQQLQRADYLIIASSRLYVPLQKLSNCKKYKVCYPKTGEYYRKLFKEESGLQKIAEFAVYPNLCFMFHVSCFMLNDQAADESFTVYDHPKIMIFKKTF